MIRAMLDTDHPVELGFTTGLLATYADLADAALIKHLEGIHGQVLLIDRGMGDPLARATIIDVENGAHRPADAPVWYDRRHALGARYLTVYCSRSTLAEIGKEMGPRSYYRWVARLDGVATVPGFTPGQGPAAVQVMGSAALGFHADYSLVFQSGWNPAPRGQLAAADAKAVASAEAHLHDALAALATVK